MTAEQAFARIWEGRRENSGLDEVDDSLEVAIDVIVGANAPAHRRDLIRVAFLAGAHWQKHRAAEDPPISDGAP